MRSSLLKTARYRADAVVFVGVFVLADAALSVLRVGGLHLRHTVGRVIGISHRLTCGIRHRQNLAVFVKGVRDFVPAHVLLLRHVVSVRGVFR